MRKLFLAPDWWAVQDDPRPGPAGDGVEYVRGDPESGPRLSLRAALGEGLLFDVRSYRGDDQVDVAEALHVARATVSAWESNRQQPRESSLMLLETQYLLNARFQVNPI